MSVNIYDKQGDKLTQVAGNATGGGSINIDNALSSTSANPVQNQVITNVINTLNSDLETHKTNTDIHVTAMEKSAWDNKAELADIPTSLPANGGNADTLDGLHSNEIASNPNLLVNPDFRINQRGNSGYSNIGYGYDHWYVGRNTGSVNAANGKCTITCTDTADTQHIIQIIEGNYSGKTLTFSLNVEAIEGCTISIRVADDNYATIGYGAISSVAGKVSCRTDVPVSFNGIIRVLISLRDVNAVGNYFTFSEPKLEIGTVATPFCPPDPATELAKCQRYYQIRSTGDIAEVDLRPGMRATPTITQLSDGNYAYSAEL